MMKKKHGFTLIELLVVMAIIALLIGLLLPALAKARAKAKQLKDGTQIEQVHQAWIIFAGEFDGVFPTPGLINREPIQLNGALQQVPGRGEEFVLANTHGALHSVCIAQNYYGAQVCVGPTEPSGNIFVYENYDFSVINPMADVYWDTGFTANLNGAGCNTSYATIPLLGKRKKVQWRDTIDSSFAIVGNRGPEQGDNVNYNSSVTLQIHGSGDQWVGNICYNDNHVELTNTLYPEGMNYRDGNQSAPDNLFRNDEKDGADSPDGSDAWLTIVSGILGSAPDYMPVLEWD